ncbi:MAG: hypothetical protein PWP51_2317 [Clostridiales bacterium]|jgi:DNA-binding transcriptional MerR regulator/uncharacterized RDD family membrane protein YckC|nr:hypothetical protein [Clostridiales bacterium]MDN5299764.1 hypothetical protein [Clostridiales bacterium]
MTIRELETRTGLTRANIRFYEYKGLIAPSRLPSGYRDYSERDIHRLLRIKLLRKLQISIEAIQELIRGTKQLDEVLEAKLQMLNQAPQDLSAAITVCDSMLTEQVPFSELNAMQYLMTIESAAANDFFKIDGDQLSQVHRPWRRFFARFFDMMVYGTLWTVLGMLLFNQNPALQSSAGNFLDGMIGLLLMLFLEPVWLHFFATTPGKAIFGMRITCADGSRLTYGQGVARTWGVIGKGIGYNIPIYNFYRLWKSFRMCSESEILLWDEDVRYTLKDTQWYRSLSYAGGIVLLFLLLYTATAFKLLPPNRGDLTIADFAENYNYYLAYFDLDSDRMVLDELGQWTEGQSDNTVIVLSISGERPDFWYEVKDEEGTLQAVGFEKHYTGDERLISSDDQYMMLSGLAFANGQKTVGLFSKMTEALIKTINAHTFESFVFTQDGIQMRTEVSFDGYNHYGGDFMIPLDAASTHVYDLIYEIRLINE